MSEKVRFTISVDAEVHAAFVEMAEAAGQSLSSAVGDWLRDTTESARFVSAKMRELRMAPSAALLELAAVQDGAARETRALSQRWRLQEERRADVGTGRDFGAAGPASARRPPSSPTGVNTPGKPGPTNPKGRK